MDISLLCFVGTYPPLKLTLEIQLTFPLTKVQQDSSQYPIQDVVQVLVLKSVELLIDNLYVASCAWFWVCVRRSEAFRLNLATFYVIFSFASLPICTLSGTTQRSSLSKALIVIRLCDKAH